MTVSEKISGIERAIDVAGTQKQLADLIFSASGDRVTQGRISHWFSDGYIPRKRARIVSQITGIPLADLLKPKKTKIG